MLKSGRTTLSVGGRKGTRRRGAGRHSHPPAALASLQLIVTIIVVGIFLLYIWAARYLLVLEENEHDATTSQASSSYSSARLRSTTGGEQRRLYQYWRDLATELAGKPSSKVIQTLENEDPFGVRKFEESLLTAESEKGAFLELEEIRTLFECPTDRITLPDQRNHDPQLAFRNGTSSYFLFFQHLRKAGGTNFCTLAKNNLPKKQVPKYYCMPDMHWNNKRCAGCFSSFTNEQIITNMHRDGHRILGNEWDPFDPSRFWDLPAVFATSFRKPLDRALSQFRFECIEDRGCKIKVVEKWWQKRQDLTNVYTWTFSKKGVRKITIGNSKSDVKGRKEAVGMALDTVARFHLVLVMEWLAYAVDLTEKTLGFKDTSSMTERVRPHINQFKRDDGQEHNQLGAAGIAKASWTPKSYLSPAQYKIMQEDLALDEILTDAGKLVM